MLSIIMLVAGLQYTQKFGVVGAGYATGAANKIKSVAQKTAERPFRAAGKAASWGAMLPVRATRPFVQAGKETVSERLQRGKYSRLLTEKGREQAADVVRAGIKKRAKLVSTEKRTVDAKNAQDMRDLRKDVNWNNADELRTRLNDELYETDKDGKIKTDEE